MQCPECGLEAVILSSGTEVEGDKSPETETRVFTVLRYHCINPNCRKGKGREAVAEGKHLIYPAKSGGSREEVNGDGEEERL